MTALYPKHIICIVLFLLMFSVPSNIAKAQSIMTYEEYQNTDHDEPYIYLLKNEDASLLYFGSRHTFNIDDPQLDHLTDSLDSYQPDFVLTEGFPVDMEGLNKSEAVQKYGEAGLTWFWAHQNSVPVESIEPSRNFEIDQLKKQGWEDNELILFYILRQISQNRTQIDQLNLKQLIPQTLNSLSERFGLTGLDSYEDFDNAVNARFPDLENWKYIPQSYFYPGPQVKEYFTNRLSTDSNIIRDRFHVQRIRDALDTHKKVFVLTGSAHAVMQKPALEHSFD